MKSGGDMSTTAIKIKGGKDGLWVILDKSVSFPVIEAEIKEKLEHNKNYFPQGTAITIVAKGFGPQSKKRLQEMFSARQVTVNFADAEPAKIIARKTAENELRRRSYTKGFEPEPVVQEVAIPPITSIPKERDIRFGKTPQHEPMMEPQPVAEQQPEIQQPAVQPSQAPTPQPKAEEMMVFNRTVRGGEEIISEGSILICGNVHVGAHIVAGGNIDIRGTCSGIVHAGSRGDSTAYIIADKMEPMQIRIANMVARCPDNVEETSGAEKAYVKDGKIIVEAVTR